MPNERFHKQVLHALALVLFSVCSFLVVGPLILPPTTPLMLDVPLQYQRALVVLLGASGLVGACLMVTFKPFAWWLLVVAGGLGVLHGLVTVPSFFPILINIVCVLYMVTVKPLYFTAPAPRAAPGSRSR